MKARYDGASQQRVPIMPRPQEADGPRIPSLKLSHASSGARYSSLTPFDPRAGVLTFLLREDCVLGREEIVTTIIMLQKYREKDNRRRRQISP